MPQNPFRLLGFRPEPFIFVALMGFMPVLEGCDSSEPIVQPPTSVLQPVPKVTGMRPAWPFGKRMTLGSQASSAKKNEEQPLMPVSFAYNFSMDSCEVTRGDWDRLMLSVNPNGVIRNGDSTWVIDSLSSVDSLRLPQTQVSWYDAILYCNARSKVLGLDTVYTYAEVHRDSKGHAYELTLLNTHWDRMGIRLPTEAEWEWCATTGGVNGALTSAQQAEEQAWYAGNSHGVLHPVGSKTANTWGYNDLYGNAMEWTFDWMGSYRQEPMVNFIGAANPNRLSEKVVKGGAYLSGWSQFRASSRSATYPMTAGTSAEYLGFRCALGVIPNAQQLSAGGEALVPFSPVTWIDTTWMKSANASLARIALVRLSGSLRYLQVLEKQGTVFRHFETQQFASVYAPAISPDGQWVAFSDGFEGMKGNSQIHVMDSHLSGTPVTLTFPKAFIPRWRVASVSQDTFLVFSSSGMDNTEDGFNSQATYQIRMAGGQPQGEPVQIAAGAYHDGLSSDGSSLVTGYRHLRTLNPLTGQAQTLFTAAQNGKPNEDTSQVCNVSLRPGNSAPQLLFLDFGSIQPSSLVGRAYAIHEVAFLTDIAGNSLNHFLPPDGVDSFDDLEWSTDSSYAIAVLQHDANPFSSIGILDVIHGSVTPILSGEGMGQPHLWLTHHAMASDSTLTDLNYQDSLGRYAEPFVHAAQSGFAAKVEVLLAQADKAEIVFVGTSQTNHGVQTSLIHSGKAINLAISSAGFATALELVKHYVVGHTPHLKAIVFETLLGLFEISDGDYVFHHMIEQSIGYQFDQHHDFWPNGFPMPWHDQIRNSTTLADMGIDSLGHTPVSRQPWNLDTLPLENLYDFKVDEPVVQANLASIREFVLEMKSLGIAVLLLQTPEYPRYAQSPFVSRYGPSIAQADLLHAQIRALCEDHPHCAFYDAHKNGHNDYVEYDFADWNHLSYQGAARLTPRIDSALAELLVP